MRGMQEPGHRSGRNGGSTLQLDQRPTTTTRTTTPPFGLAAVLASFLGEDVPIAIECYDGSRLGPDHAKARLIVRNEDALRYVITAPGELGFARAYVAGALDLEGDI